MQPRTPHRRWQSLGWSLLLVPFLFLPYRWLWFPCGLAAVLLVRPGTETLRSILSRHGTLIVGSVFILLVRTLLDWAWWLPWLVVFSAATLIRSSRQWSPRLGYALMPFVAVAAVAVLLRPDTRALIDVNPRLPDDKTTIVCAGDSLTSGVRPGTDEGTYVAVFRDRLPCSVINAGVANDRAADLLQRLDRTVLQPRPDVVLLFIGGNDYLDGTPRRQFARTLDELAGRVGRTGAALVLVEVPSGILWNPYAGVYRNVARRHGAILVPETRLRAWYSVELLLRGYLPDPLTIDGIHLSQTGAGRVGDWLEPYLRRAAEKHNSR